MPSIERDPGDLVSETIFTWTNDVERSYLTRGPRRCRSAHVCTVKGVSMSSICTMAQHGRDTGASGQKLVVVACRDGQLY